MNVAADGSKLLGDFQALILALNDIAIRGGIVESKAIDGAQVGRDRLAAVGLWHLVKLIGRIRAQVTAVASASAHILVVTTAGGGAVASGIRRLGRGRSLFGVLLRYMVEFIVGTETQVALESRSLLGDGDEKSGGENSGGLAEGDH
ncbi:MAG: hypothetical protein SGARI_007811, partial [Bacillariaceae sp.]